MGQETHKHEDHGGVKLYWIFALILCVITFFEWLIFEKREPWGITNQILVPSLAVMSLVKFVMVVGWYMHLRHDTKLLKQMFIAAFVVVLMLFTGLYVLMA